MISKLVKGKVYIFIDAANIFYSQRTMRWRISYVSLKQYLGKECNLGKCFVYTAFVKGNKNQARFLKMLDKAGYLVRTKPVKTIKIRKGFYQWKGNLDVELTMDVLENLKKFDSLILFSGDSDFAPLLQKVKEHGKRVLVASTKDHVAKELLEQAKFVNLKKLEKEIKLENGG